jgi:hypothetical protein
MITSPSGSQKVTVHGTGPQSSVMSLSQFRDAAGYSKQIPLPAREVTLPGVVRLAGTTVAINTNGIVDGNQISGLAATDGLIGAAVATDGIPEGAVVTTILKHAAPGVPGTVLLSNVEPFAPTTAKPQPVVFSAIVRRNAIHGLSSTDGLDGAYVSGGGLPDGAKVASVSVPAVVATNTRPGVPGEVLLEIPVLPPKAAPIPPAAAPAPAGSTAPSVAAPATPAPPPASAAPADVTFKIPTAPIIIPDGVSRLVLTPAEPLEALVVTMPPNPVDGQVAFIFSTLAIAGLVVLPNQNQSIYVAPPKAAADEPLPEKVPALALAAETGIGYLFSAPNATWDRIL